MSKKTLLLLVLLTLVMATACSAPTPAPTLTPVPPTAVPLPSAVAPTALPTSTSVPVAPTAVPPSPTIPGPTGPITVSILHTNDMHGYLEGEKLKGGDGSTFEFGGVLNVMGTIARLKQETGPNTIILDGGDFWTGTYASNHDDGKAIVAAMNSLGYDALAPGNHDFDHGQDVLKARAADAKFPMLASNLIEDNTGQAPSWIKPYIIKQVAGIRFGIIGVTYPGTPAIQRAANIKGLKFLPDAASVSKILPEVRSKSDIVILLAHEGLDYIEPMLSGGGQDYVDVIVSAHTHTEMRQPKTYGKTIVIQAGSKAQYVGRMDLAIDPTTKKIVNYSKNNLLVSAVNNKSTPPKDVADMMGKLIADSREAINRPIGETLTDLSREYTSDGRTSGEYPLANLIADAMLAANQAGDRPADLAWHNQGGIRADIPKGPISYGAVYQVVPMDNVLMAIDLNGATIKEALEIATSCPRTNSVIAGMTFKYDCSKPSGQRVSDIMIQGKPMDPQKVYRVQTIDYLAGGGDGLTPMTKGTNPSYGDPVVDVVADYVAKHSPLNLKVEGRIVPVK